MILALPATRYRYVAYGLTIDSTLPLPELTPLSSAEFETADVAIRVESLPAIPSNASDIREGHWMYGDAVWLSFEGACRICIRGGREILVEGESGVDNSVLRLFVLGVALGALLHQRGFLTLHASAAVVNGSVVAFLGAAGAGKSTMTAALQARGHTVVADDIVAVCLADPARPTVQSGFPRLKLTPDSAAALGHNTAQLNKVHATHPKYGFPVAEGAGRSSLRLERIYILAQGDWPEIECLERQHAVVEIIRHTYAVGMLVSQENKTTHMRQCAALTAEAHIRRLKRPLDFQALHEVAALVESDCGEANAGIVR
ncbi:HPr kinase [Capsulimonas corticalis]|uniref:HPr kinase n=1 Tax=Capsulimonas corticalis TaxID=2219043 RepID=A0A402CTQ3_9BACT|nr:hypothetical protein [Capsulimonas corticalis]BDI30651.1 HPr kinase [Capsulimonas corticalis]